VVAHFQLVLDEVLGLGKGANEFVSLFLPEAAYFGSLDDFLFLEFLFFLVEVILLDD